MSGDWNTAADWTPAGLPGSTSDATIDALAPAGGSYTVTIAAGESEVVNSLTMNGVNNLAGSNAHPYNAAALEIDGILTFAAGAPGSLGGSPQNLVVLNGGTIINGGTLEGLIQGQGNVLLTGTNALDIATYLQALSGTITVDTVAISNIAAGTLSSGVFEAKGPGAAINLGGPQEHLTVIINTIDRTLLNATTDTHLTLSDPNATINEWNGTAYVPIESTLTDIAAGGVLDVLAGRNYITSQTLKIDAGTASFNPGILNLQAGEVSPAFININGGVVQGNATINNGVLNNGTLTALGGTLTVSGGLSGTGTVMFDFDNEADKLNPVGATLEVHSVSAGQTIVMNADDTLQIDAASSFAGTINAVRGGKIVLAGVTATSVTLSGNALVISNGAQTVATLNLAGSYTSDQFSMSGSTVTVTGEVILQGASAEYVVANDGGSLYVQDTVAGRDGTQIVPGVTKMVFTDGTGMFDPTGAAEDLARVYKTVLGRAPDEAGLAYWTSQVNGNVPLSAIANAFAASPEFLHAFGSQNNPDFINQMYENALGRPADAGGSQYWVSQLTSGISRGAVSADIAGSPESQADTLATAGDNNNGEVYRLYETALARAPDAAGQAYWSSVLTGGASVTQVAQGLVGSAEFQQNFGALTPGAFVTELYKTALHRAPDAAGLQYWTTALQQGTSQASMVVGFSDSGESRALTAGATHANWVFIPT